MKRLQVILLLLLIGTMVNAQTYGSFTDPRDGQVYKTIKIGSKTWMAENLNYDIDGSMCYEDTEDFCHQFSIITDSQ